MGSIGGFEWVLIILAILLLFGAKRIPELARGIGQGIQEFRKASDDIKREIDKGKDDVNNTVNEPKKEETENK
jgi:sec-independent protein translocase protein TatA